MIFAFLAEGQFHTRRKKKYQLYRTYRKHHVSLYFLRKIIFHFPSAKNIYHIFGKKMPSLGNIIFSEHLKNISYFHVFFGETSSFIFRLKKNIIFWGKRNTVSSFLMIQEKSYSNAIFLGKIIFSEHLEKKYMIFRAVFFARITFLFLRTTPWRTHFLLSWKRLKFRHMNLFQKIRQHKVTIWQNYVYQIPSLKVFTW